MKSFDLGEHLNDIYAAFPEANRQPVLALQLIILTETRPFATNITNKWPAPAERLSSFRQ